MLSYRHAFHAGNHADVLKHIVLLQALKHATQKDKPFWYIDTHAGAGMYALDKGYATQNAEHAGGISLLWHTSDLPPAIKEYVNLIRRFNPDKSLKHYPGSPLLAYSAMRANDRLRLFELHPNDYKLLNQSFKHLGLTADNRRVMTQALDGFAGIKALLPPPPRRAVVLIDPPYEEKQDYNRVVEMAKDSIARFATGTYLIWYPLLQRPEPLQMVGKLKKLHPANWLDVTLTVQTPAIGGFGMHGSGLFVINPPWTLPDTLNGVMPVLLDKLALDHGAAWTLTSEIE
jgi:23S rRNA (adenine2030-N6)-methyltransferase